MSSKTNGFAQGTVLRVAYGMLGFTSSVLLARIGLTVLRPKRLTTSDYFVFIAYAMFVTKCALYIAVSPYMQRVYGVSNGKIPPYSSLEKDKVIMSKMLFVAFCMFWSVLWSVKFSLLFLYRRLLTGISKRYTVSWWCISTFCLLTFVGNYAIYFHTCGSILGFWNGGCVGNPAKRVQLINLYYSFTADTSTNLMIMALPIWLTRNLRLPRNKKISILGLFASGLVCIAFAGLRVGQVARNAAEPEADGLPLDPTWLAIWGMVECSIAVTIGCCPAFAVLLNTSRTKVAYDLRVYRKKTGSGTGQKRSNLIHLTTIGSRGKRERDRQFGLNTTDSHWADAHSSQEELRASHDGVLISTTVTQVESPELSPKSGV